MGNLVAGPRGQVPLFAKQRMRSQTPPFSVSSRLAGCAVSCWSTSPQQAGVGCSLKRCDNSNCSGSWTSSSRLLLSLSAGLPLVHRVSTSHQIHSALPTSLALTMSNLNNVKPKRLSVHHSLSNTDTTNERCGESAVLDKSLG